MEITYQVYRLKDDETVPTGNIYASSYDAADVASAGGVQAGELICEYKVTNLQGNTGGGHANPVKLYFNNLEMISDGSSNGTWTNKTSESDLSKVVDRGGRYFVTYTVKCSEDPVYGYACDHTSGQHYYPACTYATGELVPYYRSQVVEVKKQEPKIERYPLTSGSNSATWKYRISDPDGAIDVDGSGNASFNVLTYDKYDAASASSTTSISVNMSAYTGTSFSELLLTSLADNKYYAVNIPYKLLTADSADKLEITSIPILFKSEVDRIADIELKGAKATADTSAQDKSKDDSSYEKALVNQGGYQYRLTVRGENIDKLAALRVTFKQDGKEDVVYDPVYLDLQAVKMEDGGTYYPYAYAYMDASALDQFDPAGSASVKVEGYFNTNVSGVNAYVSQQEIGDSKKNLIDENIFAMQMIDAQGSGRYVYQASNTYVNSPTLSTDKTDSVVKSLFIPGAEKGAGFDETAKTLAQRYASLPLILLDSDYMISRSMGITFDESGMKDSTGKYIMTEKLGLQELDFSFSKDAAIDLSEILPAVERIGSASAGVTSILMNLEAKGTGASENSKIYAQIYEPDGSNYKTLNVEVEEQNRGDENVFVYVVDSNNRYVTNESEYFKKENNETNYIPVIREDDKLVLPLRIQGLRANTRYRIVMYTYDTAGNRQDLYSIDGGRIGYPYEVQTKNQLEIDTDGPAYIYTTYADKKLQFGFGVPGDEGTGMTVSYWVEDTSGQTVIASQNLPPIGNESYKYYAQDKADNNPMSIPLAPGGALKLGTSYKLKIKAVSDEGGDLLGEKEISFTTPARLSEPTFMIQATPSTAENGTSNLKVSVVCTDSQHTVVNDRYTVNILDTDGTVIKTGTFNKTTNNSIVTNTSMFSGLAQNTNYAVEVVAQVDLDNDGNADAASVTRRINVLTTTGSSATVGATADTNNLELRLTSLANFDEVEKIYITAYKEGTTIYNTSVALSDGCVSGNASSGYMVTLPWGDGRTIEAGEYIIQLQYRDANEGVLGNGETTITIKSQTGLSSLFRAAKATATSTATPTATPKVTAAPTVTPEATAAPTATPETTPAPTAIPEATAAPIATPSSETNDNSDKPESSDTSNNNSDSNSSSDSGSSSEESDNDQNSENSSDNSIDSSTSGESAEGSDNQ